MNILKASRKSPSVCLIIETLSLTLRTDIGIGLLTGKILEVLRFGIASLDLVVTVMLSVKLQSEMAVVSQKDPSPVLKLCFTMMLTNLTACLAASQRAPTWQTFPS